MSPAPPSLLVLSESRADLDEFTAQDETDFATLAARAAGFEVVPLPREHEVTDATRAAAVARGFAAVRAARAATARPAVWLGWVPSYAHYRGVYDAALACGARLLNAPEEHRRAMDVLLASARLGALTAATVEVTDASQCAAAAARVGLPAFVKGPVFSRKAHGWDACVATTEPALRACVAAVLADGRAAGRAAVRALLPLRRTGPDVSGFRQSREFRTFVLAGEMVACGYYWPFPDRGQTLEDGEARDVRALAEQAAARLAVPWLTVDVGQLEEGRWVVIETNDPQFSGLSYIDPHALWAALAARFPAAR